MQTEMEQLKLILNEKGRKYRVTSHGGLSINVTDMAVFGKEYKATFKAFFNSKKDTFIHSIDVATSWFPETSLQVEYIKIDNAEKP